MKKYFIKKAIIIVYIFLLKFAYNKNKIKLFQRLSPKLKQMWQQNLNECFYIEFY